MEKLRVAILISGRGSNMQALIDAARAPSYPAAIVLVVSNNPDAPGLQAAADAGIATHVVDRRAFAKGPAGTRAFEDALAAAVRSHDAALVCLAGFMRVLSAEFVAGFEGRMINIHPSLLPAFRGLDAQEAALAAGVKIAGCTVHFVTAETDGGPIIGQAATPVLEGDTPDSLAARILVEEHRLYPECVRRIALGEVRLSPDGRVALGGPAASGALLNPPVQTAP